MRYAVRGGATVGSYAPPQLWRRAQRPLLAALKRGGAQRPRLTPAVRRSLVRYFTDDVAQLESLLGQSFQDWLGEEDRGTYAVRSSFAPSARDASQ
jgi:hypothetical protein